MEPRIQTTTQDEMTDEWVLLCVFAAILVLLAGSAT